MDHSTGHAYSESFFPFWSLLLCTVLQHKRTAWFTYVFPDHKITNSSPQFWARSWECNQWSTSPLRRNSREICRCSLRSGWQHWQSVLLSERESPVCVLHSSVADDGVALGFLTDAGSSTMDVFLNAFYVTSEELYCTVNCCLEVWPFGFFFFKFLIAVALKNLRTMEVHIGYCLSNHLVCWMQKKDPKVVILMKLQRVGSVFGFFWSSLCLCSLSLSWSWRQSSCAVKK